MAQRREPGNSADGKATLEVVAREAGVSRATVSRVINGGQRVHPRTLRTVERAIERLGYSPNRAARSLVTRRSDSIGLVIPEPTARLFGDPFFPRLVRGISETLSARDLQRAHRVAAHMIAGMVWINCYKRVNPGSPFGGVRASGYGREMGFEAMRDYTEAKSVWVNVDAQIPPWYPR